MALLMLGWVAPAQAFPYTGSCALTLTFSFSSPVHGAAGSVSRPGFSISVSPTTDLNPLTGAWEPCLISFSGINPWRTTWVTAGGSSGAWTCEATLADGSWNQGWTPSPDYMDGNFVLTGGPDGWTMVIHNDPYLSFFGKMELTVHPDDATKLAACETTGISTLKLTGTLTFQDLR